MLILNRSSEILILLSRKLHHQPLLLYHIPKNIRLAGGLFEVDKLKLRQYLERQEKIEFLGIMIDNYVSTLNKNLNNEGNFKFQINNMKFIQACIENFEFRESCTYVRFVLASSEELRSIDPLLYGNQDDGAEIYKKRK